MIARLSRIHPTPPLGTRDGEYHLAEPSDDAQLELLETVLRLGAQDRVADDVPQPRPAGREAGQQAGHARGLRAEGEQADDDNARGSSTPEPFRNALTRVLDLVQPELHQLHEAVGSGEARQLWS